jgi:hypothetical protein
MTVALEESTPTKLVALVEEHFSDQFGRLSLEVEGVEPYRITRVDAESTAITVSFCSVY